MRKEIIFASILFLIGMGLIVGGTVSAIKPGHKCRWDLCPYKGVTWIERAGAVTQYVGEDYAGSDSWCIDMLHLEHPKAEYEELEDLLFGK